MKKVIKSEQAPLPVGPYSQAILSGKTLYCSGQIPIDPATGTIHAQSVEEQTRQIMKNIAEVLKAAGMDYSHIVKTSIFLTDLKNFAVVNGIYGECFVSDPPARSTIQVAALPLGSLVEIECIAVADD